MSDALALLDDIWTGKKKVEEDSAPKSHGDALDLLNDIWYGKHATLIEKGLNPQERSQIAGTVEPRNFVTQTIGNTLPGQAAEAVNRATMPEGVPYESLPQQDYGAVGNAASQLLSFGTDVALTGGMGGAAAGEAALGERLAGEAVGRTVARGAVEGATTLGGLAALHDPAKQYIQTGEVNPVETAKEVGKSAVLGAALGPAGAIENKAAKIAAEAATLTGASAALEGKLPTAEEALLNTGTILGMHLGGAAITKLAALANKETVTRKDWTEATGQKGRLPVEADRKAAAVAAAEAIKPKEQTNEGQPKAEEATQEAQGQDQAQDQSGEVNDVLGSPGANTQPTHIAPVSFQQEVVPRETGQDVTTATITPKVGQAAAFPTDVQFGTPEATTATNAAIAATPEVDAAAAYTNKQLSAIGESGIRSSGGRKQHLTEQLDTAYGGIATAFDVLPKDAGIQVQMHMEEGHPERIENPKVRDALVALRDEQQTGKYGWRSAIAAIKQGQQTVIENYWRHKWTDPQAAQSWLDNVFRKRPLRGQASFLKQRKIPTIREGIEAGLVPAETNPVRLIIGQIAEQAHFVEAHGQMTTLERLGLKKFVPLGAKPKEGYETPAIAKTTNDPSMTVFGPRTLTVKEAFNEQLMNGLVGFANNNLGIDVERKSNIGGGAWGRHVPGEGEEPGMIKTKFGGPESVVAHEIGHELNDKFNLFRELGGDPARPTKHDPVIGKEWSDLARERLPKNPTAEQKAYAFHPDEKAAALIEAYVHAPDLLAERAPNLLKAFEAFLDVHPDLQDLREIKPGLRLGTNEANLPVPGRSVLGHWSFPKPISDLYQAHLAPGLERSGLYRGWRGVSNDLNMVQLGASGFHVSTTSAVSVMNEVGEALLRGSRGELGQAAKHLLRSPLAPVLKQVEGHRLVRDIRALTKDIKDPTVKSFIEAQEIAGGRTRYSKTFSNSHMAEWVRAFRDTRYADSAWGIARNGSRVLYHSLGSVFEATMKPIMRMAVNFKVAYEMDRFKDIMERHGSLDSLEARQELMKAWNLGDDLYGQVVYDNLLVNKVYKDIAFATIRAPGWTGGLLRWIGRGTGDLVTTHNRIAAGKPWMTPDMAYMLALPLVHGTAAAIYQYMHTGEWPGEAKDFFYPKNGGVNSDGTASRVSIPGYMKDAIAWATGPISTLSHKLNPALSTAWEAINNRDYYGNRIVDPHAQALSDQLAQEADFLFHQPVPFTAKNLQQFRDEGKSLTTSGEALLGITPAPGRFQRTPALELAKQLSQDATPASRSAEDIAKGRERARLVTAAREGDRSQIQAKLAAGEITPAQKKSMLKRADAEPILNAVRAPGLTVEHAMDIWEKAAPEERAIIQQALQKKVNTALKTRPRAERDAIRERAESLGLGKKAA